MTPEQFAYWLQGFAEIAKDAPSEDEWNIIKDHLSTVFLKVTPNRQTATQQGMGAAPIATPSTPYTPAPYTPAPYNPPAGVRDFEKIAPFPYPTPTVIC